MKKRGLALILVCIMAITLLLTGCGGDDKDVAENKPIIWYMRAAVNDNSNKDKVMAAVNEIVKKELGTTIDLRLFDSATWDERMNLIIASGEEFDICFTANFTNKFDANMERDAFMDISDLLKKYGKDILAKTDDFMWDAVTVNGGIYAIPGQSKCVNETSIVFKKDLVEKYGFDYKAVKDIEDLEPYLAQLKANEPGVIPICVTANTSIGRSISDRYFGTGVPGVVFDAEQEKFVLTVEDKETMSKHRVLNDYYKKGYIAKDANAKTEVLSEAKSGRYAILPRSGSYTEDGSKVSSLYGFPCVETLIDYDTISTGSCTSAMNAISKTSKQPEKAMQVLNLIWKNPELSNMLAYGLEGQDYVVVSEESAEYKSIKPNEGSNQKWGIWHNWIGPLWDQWDSTWNRREALEEMRNSNKNGTPSPLLGFKFKNENVKTEIAKLSSIEEEVKPIFNTGCMPDFDKFIASYQKKMEDANVENVLKELQLQYDEWKKNK